MEQLGDSGNIDVWLYKRVEQTLIGHVHLGDTHDVVNVRNDRNTARRHKKNSSISRTCDVLYTSCNYLCRGEILVETFNGNKLVDFTDFIGSSELNARRICNCSAIGRHHDGEVRVGDRDGSQVLCTVLKEALLCLVEVIRLQVVYNRIEVVCGNIREFIG